MPMVEQKCGCEVGQATGEERRGAAVRNDSTGRYVAAVGVAVVAWWLIYRQLAPVAAWATYTMLGLEQGTHLAGAVEFFLFDTPKVLMLLTLIVFWVGVIRSFFTPERTRRILAGKGESVGTILAGLLGIVTPFCSCSAVPLFLGFVTAGVPLGVSLTFLISAPMVNEVALVLLYAMLGWKIAGIYLSTGLAVAMVSGWTIGRLHMEHHVEEWVYQTKAGDSGPEQRLDWVARINYGLETIREIVGKVWIYVILGIAVGAGIHGYVPENFLAGIMGKSAWWSVPLVVLIGIPMYSNAAGMIPVVEALLAKGAALGTVLAFMMAVISISTPEAIMLRKVLKPRLIGLFLGVVTVGILIVGYLFNVLPLQDLVTRGHGLR
ncbi:MAG: permease [candidate division NC10 bacterium]|nr:permease [candidate division NC10 bacterium]